jgi:CheY-like chemotaxis protein
VNSKDAMPEGGTLLVTTAVKKGEIVIRIVDTGSGMTEEVRQRCIDPFYSTKGIGKGTGLGLSMVHGLASQLGGRLTIESEVDFGTTITLHLPSSEGMSESVEIAAAEKSLVNFKRVLLVDDEELVRAATAHMLIQMGCEVLEAEDAKQALAILQSENNIDLLITDHLMPGTTGAELAKTVGEKWADMPVLIVTGYGRYEELEGLALLTKPFRQDDLEAKLSALNYPKKRCLAAS